MVRVIVALGLILYLGLYLGSAAALASAEPPAATAMSPVTRLSSESRDRFRAALSAYRAEDWSEAAREFKDPGWIATPLSDYALLFQAGSQFRAGDVAAARAAVLRAVEGRLAASAFLEAATLVSRAGDQAAAVTLFRRFLDAHSEHAGAPRARLALGQALLAEGRTLDASRAFNGLWILSPAAPEAESATLQLRVLAERGLAGPAPTARERVERAERLLAARLGDAAKSEAEALVTDEVSADLRERALRIILNVSQRARRSDAALGTVNRALASLPASRRAPWLLDLARLQQTRKGTLGLPTLDKLVAEHPKSPEAAEALLLKAQILEGTGSVPEALIVYGTLAASYPGQEEAGKALWRLGWLAWFQGAHAEAAGTWSRLVTIRGGQVYREAAMYWIGRADELRGEAEGAARRFAELLGEAPRSYYGLLAARRGGRASTPRSSPLPVSLPIAPLEPLQADAMYSRVEALRAVGLATFADEEMAEMARGALGNPKRLYALSGAYAQESRYHLALRILRRHFLSLARSGAGSTPRAFWELFYPLGWRNELMGAAGHAAIDPFLVAAVVREESSFDPQARSRVGARGLMQLMPETARPLAQARRLAFNNGELLDDPVANLDLGTAFLATLLREFGDARLAVAAYNAGPARVREWWGARRSDDLEVWVEQIPFNETRAFVKRVLLAWDEYGRLYRAVGEPVAAPGDGASQ